MGHISSGLNSGILKTKGATHLSTFSFLESNKYTKLDVALPLSFSFLLICNHFKTALILRVIFTSLSRNINPHSLVCLPFQWMNFKFTYHGKIFSHETQKSSYSCQGVSQHYHLKNSTKSMKIHYWHRSINSRVN